jgi:hypothetical protein
MDASRAVRELLNYIDELSQIVLLNTALIAEESKNQSSDCLTDIAFNKPHVSSPQTQF